MSCQSLVLFLFLLFLPFQFDVKASGFDSLENESVENLKTPIFSPNSRLEIPVAILQEWLEESYDSFHIRTKKFEGYIFSFFFELKNENSYSLFMNKNAHGKALFYPWMGEETRLWFYQGAWGLTFYIGDQLLDELGNSVDSEEKSLQVTSHDKEQEYTLHPGSQIQIPLFLLRDHLADFRNSLDLIGVKEFVLSAQGNLTLEHFDKFYRGRMHGSVLFYPSLDREKASQGSWFCRLTSSLVFNIDKEKL